MAIAKNWNCLQCWFTAVRDWVLFDISKSIEKGEQAIGTDDSMKMAMWLLAVFSEVQNLINYLSSWFDCCLCVHVYVQCLWLFFQTTLDVSWNVLNMNQKSFPIHVENISTQALLAQAFRDCWRSVVVAIWTCCAGCLVNGVGVCWLPGRNGPECKLSVQASARILPPWTLVMSCF